MPLYEYRCNTCGEKSTVFTKSVSATVEPICSRCQSVNLTRLVSAFTYRRPYSPSYSGGASQTETDPDYYADPRNIGRHLEQDFQKMGMEMPSETRERLEAAREGHMPKEID